MPLKFETQTQSLQDPAQSDASPGGTNRGATAQRGCWRQSPAGARGARQGLSLPPPAHPWERHEEEPGGRFGIGGTTVLKSQHLHALLPCHGKAGPGGHGQTPLLPPPAAFRGSDLPALKKTRCQLYFHKVT